MKTIIFLFSVLASFSSFAQQISDPQGLLAKSDQFLGAQPFAQNFVQGMKYTMSFKDCISCREERFIHYAIDSVASDGQGHSSATIVTVGTQEKITMPEDFWNGINGNMIRAVIYHVAQGGFGNITVVDAHDGQMDVKLNGEMKSVATFTLHATAKNQLGMTEDETMTVTRDLFGYAQLITWTEKQWVGGSYTRTMTEFSR
jgi:hypothetical protein